ncbi:MAG: AraC family transcriptional regulator, partial [Paenibacillus sp.]|nr:AraC family transcriptional regulator [Paenibacillus sp.]
RYVGVSPKWVIQRYRLHEAAEQMERGEVADWAKLSLELGYYDQAHLIKAFKAIVGKSPEQYSKAVSR